MDWITDRHTKIHRLTHKKSAARKLRFCCFSLRGYLLTSQVLETMSTLETVKAFPSWSIFIPELLPAG
jgi:hypothetical protein